ncbi:MAG: hypothetical protein JWO45_828 [Spartobacteria bacterium]|nr:hypothetical protein [Spartobacteria bacterium]
MILRDAVLTGGIVRRPIDRTDCSLASDAALKLGSHFVGASFFQRIGTTARSEDECCCQENRQALHLFILESDRGIARL